MFLGIKCFISKGLNYIWECMCGLVKVSDTEVEISGSEDKMKDDF